MVTFPQLPVVLMLIAGVVCPAAAQIQGPPESVRGFFGTGSPAAPQALTASIDFGAGYEENSLPVTAPTGEFGPIRSGYATAIGGTVRYQRGQLPRYFVGSATGAVNHQQIASQYNVNRLLQLSGLFQAGMELGRRAGVAGEVRVSYEPTYVFSAFDSLGAIANPEPDLENPPVTGQPPTVTQQPWLSSDATGRFYYNTTPRQRSEVAYTNLRRRPISGTGFEIRANAVTVAHAWNRTPNTGVDVVYRFSDNPQDFQTTGVQPLRTHTVETRARFARRFSPVRQLSLLVGGGVVRTFTETPAPLGGSNQVTFFAPTISGIAFYDFARRWQVSLNARRDVSVLNGLTPEPFASNSATLTLSTSVGRRLRFRVANGWTRGASELRDTGTFTLLTAEAETSVGLTSYSGMAVTYRYYQHTFENVALASPAFPNEYTRNSVTVGFTLWLPLYGIF